MHASSTGADPGGVGAIAHPKTYESKFFSPWFCTIYKIALAIWGHLALHCFVTAVSWSILHLSYSREPAIRVVST